MSLASTNPHQMCAEKAVSPVALLQLSFGNDTKCGTKCKAVHLAVDGMSCNLEKPKNNKLSIAAWGMGGFL